MPAWEEFNRNDNFTPPGNTSTYAKYQYVLVLPPNSSTWEPLSQFLAAYPQYATIEAKDRQMFITDGMPNLNSPTCAS